MTLYAIRMRAPMQAGQPWRSISSRKSSGCRHQRHESIEFYTRIYSSLEIPTDITRRKIYSVLLIASRCARICKSSCRGICLLAFVSDGFPRQDAMSHILVIDDEQSVCRVIEAVLTAAGYTVTTAPDGRSGSEAAEKQDFSVALVDLCMPNLNGIGALAGRRRMEPLLSR